MKQIIHTNDAPAAIGAYSQAVKVENHVYVSGQIPLDPKTMQLVEGGINEQIRQVFHNLQAVIKAAGGNWSDMVKLNIFLCDLAHFAMVNEIMMEFCSPPFPAR